MEEKKKRQINASFNSLLKYELRQNMFSSISQILTDILKIKNTSFVFVLIILTRNNTLKCTHSISNVTNPLQHLSTRISTLLLSPNNYKKEANKEEIVFSALNLFAISWTGILVWLKDLDRHVDNSLMTP